jgi:hypothetical protein
VLFSTKLGWATFWATFFTNASGHPDLHTSPLFERHFNRTSCSKLTLVVLVALQEEVCSVVPVNVLAEDSCACTYLVVASYELSGIL